MSAFPRKHSYYEEVAKDLVHADEIILIGHGTGKSSAAEFLMEYLKAHHPEEFQRIAAIETADLSALTEPQIEEIGKRQIQGRHSFRLKRVRVYRWPGFEARTSTRADVSIAGDRWIPSFD